MDSFFHIFQHLTPFFIILLDLFIPLIHLFKLLLYESSEVYLSALTQGSKGKPAYQPYSPGSPPPSELSKEEQEQESLMLYHLDRHRQLSLGVGIDQPVQDVVRGKKTVAEFDFVRSSVRQVRMVVEALLFVSRE
jgi:hypothetical protein